MKHIILTLIILLNVLVSSSPTAKVSNPETLIPLADTYVDYWEATQPHGDSDYLELSNFTTGLSIVVLMFDISRVLKTPSEVKLRLYCYYSDSPHVVGVHWCVNNTWNEENLTAFSFRGFFRTAAEDAVRVYSKDVWYEWKATNLFSIAEEEDYEKITLTLEVEDPLEGMARSRFASKDQPTQEMREYGPQLVFTYRESKANSRDTIIIVASGLTATAVIAFLTYKLSKKHTKKTRHRKARSKSNLRGRQKRTHKRDA